MEIRNFCPRERQSWHGRAKQDSGMKLGDDLILTAFSNKNSLQNRVFGLGVDLGEFRTNTHGRPAGLMLVTVHWA